MRRAAALGLAAIAVAGCGRSGSPAGTGAGSLPLDARSPLEPPGAKLRVLVQFHRPSLAEAGSRSPFTPGRQRAYVASLRAEAMATQSSLRAKGVTLEQPVLYARVWNGFAATIRARDLPRLQALGLRAEPVRRFYGAAVAITGRAPAARSAAPGKPSVALLDGARHGVVVAALLRQGLGRSGGSIHPIRVAGPRRDPVTGGTVTYGTTDELLEGLERAVDPNGDGATSDRIPVALVGVSSPYAGFADSPEAEAVAGATALGTLVVAPAGNEGRSAGSLGTIGSPGAAPGALAVGALEGGGSPALPTVDVGLATGRGREKAAGTLLGGPLHPLSAPVAALAGPSQANSKQRGRALGAEPLEYFSVDASPRARGSVVVVPSRIGSGRPPALATRAAAASQGGARALVVCEPDPSRALPALPDGTGAIPVIGLRGDAARRALDVTAAGGGLAFLSAAHGAVDRAPAAPGRSSSRGPTYALAPKPDLAAPGTAMLDGGFAAGTSVAAARVAALAARLRAAMPAAAPAEIASRLVQSATPSGPLLAAGAGSPSLARAAALTVVAEPALVAFGRQDAGAAFSATAKVSVRNTGSATQIVTPSASVPGVRAGLAPARLTLPAHHSRTLTVTLTGTRPPGYLTGTLRLGPARVPLALPVGPPPPALLSPLRVEGARGVRFSAGAVAGRGDAVSVSPLGDLTLQILDPNGTVVRELTPQGGARDLLPGEYAYTLTSEARGALTAGHYRFRATAHGPAAGPPVVRTSPSFALR